MGDQADYYQSRKYPTACPQVRRGRLGAYLQVDWAIRSEAGPLEVGILLFTSSSVVGRVGINNASGEIETTSTGIVGAVSAMRDSEGWTRVQFEFSPALDQYPLQVLFYPTGVITGALAEDEIYEVTDPVFSARTP